MELWKVVLKVCCLAALMAVHLVAKKADWKADWWEVLKVGWKVFVRVALLVWNSVEQKDD